jgi:diguanylate cyclase (GGDEF)-like protein
VGRLTKTQRDEAGDDGTRLPAETYVALVRTLYRDLQSLIVASLIATCSAVITVVATGSWLVAAAAIAMTIISALRFVLFASFSRHRLDADSAPRWRQLYEVGVCAYLASFGCWVCAVFAASDDPVMLLLAFTGAVCYSLGISNRNFAFPESVGLQILSIGLPLSAACLIKGGGYLVLLLTVVFPLFAFIRRSAAHLRALLLEELTAKLASLETSARLDIAISSLNRGLCLFSKRRTLSVINSRMREYLGVPADVELLDAPLSEMARYVQRAMNPQHWATFKQALSETSSRPGEERTVDASSLSGDWFEISIKHNLDETIVIVAQDVTERRNLNLAIERIAKFDVVTALPNRFQFESQMAAIRAARPEEPVALVFIDLDGFKQVNDTLGHRRGDLLLAAAGDRLNNVAPAGSLVARWGGDEFVVLMFSPMETAVATVASILQTLISPYCLDGFDVVIGASGGVACGRLYDVEPDLLLRQADMALYAAKGAGRNQLRTFEAGMQAEALVRRALELDVRAALAERKFELHYQPIVDIQSGAIRSFEALARWRRDGEFVSPEVFIPAIEQLGLIVEFGAWALDRACRDCATWPEDVNLAVNISALQLTTNSAPQIVREALARASLPARRLELEITESTLMDARSEARPVIEALRRMGVSIAIDDFGTGYSSLSYLLTCPVDKLKIDQSFVRALGKEAGAIALVDAVARLGSQLGMQVVAEGIETEEQAALLRSFQGVSEGQGYFYGRPTCAEDLRRRFFDDDARAVA